MKAVLVLLAVLAVVEWARPQPLAFDYSIRKSLMQNNRDMRKRKAENEQPRREAESEQRKREAESAHEMEKEKYRREMENQQRKRAMEKKRHRHEMEKQQRGRETDRKRWKQLFAALALFGALLAAYLSRQRREFSALQQKLSVLEQWRQHAERVLGQEQLQLLANLQNGLREEDAGRLNALNSLLEHTHHPTRCALATSAGSCNSTAEPSLELMFEALEGAKLGGDNLPPASTGRHRSSSAPVAISIAVDEEEVIASTSTAPLQSSARD